MILSLELSEKVLAHLVAATGVTEVHGADGGNLMVAQGVDGGPSGTMRLFTGGSIQKIVWTKLQVPARGVTTCMIFAFSDPDSALPHFTLDCADHGDESYAFHLDLMPRVELALNIDYMDEVFVPLSPLYETGRAIEGMWATGTTPRQFAMMSPWMLVNFCTEAAFRSMGEVVMDYADHWIGVINAGISKSVQENVSNTPLRERDAQVRYNLFSPEIDPVWGRVESMIGKEGSERIRSNLQLI